jgi:hypothetical protein
MNLNVPTRTARLTCGTRRSYQSMNHTTQNASSVTARCKRFTQFLISNSRVQGSIQQITSYTQPVDNFRQKLTSRLGHAERLWKLDWSGTLTARALKGSERAASRIARSVAIVIGISLSMQSTAVGIGSIDPYYDLYSLADYQLTDKQYNCHQEIVFRESSFRIDARNGSHHGYYQIRNEKLINAPYDYQFYFYWKYVQHRYGTTKYDEPNYCNALHHLKTKGWQ